jgi:hypothetical protein
MKIFGFSLMTVALFLIFFWLGTKNPGFLSGLRAKVAA